MEKFAKLFNFTIQHKFYQNQKIPLSIFPSEITKKVLAENNLFFKQNSDAKYCLIKLLNENFFFKKDEIFLDFELIPNSDEFYYCSENEILVENTKAKDFSISLIENKNSIKNKKSWKNLQFCLKNNLEKIEKEIDFEIIIPNKEKFFEFILIPKYNDLNLDLKLIEEKKLIEFEEKAAINFMNFQALRFKTKNKIPLTNNLNYKIKLIEIRKFGEKILSEEIPIPKAENISQINPKDTITTYYYF